MLVMNVAPCKKRVFGGMMYLLFTKECIENYGPLMIIIMVKLGAYQVYAIAHVWSLHMCSIHFGPFIFSS